MIARGIIPTPPGRNKWEQRYHQELELLRDVGEILWYAYEPMSLKIATGARYTPDFIVMLADRTLELHEVKGMWREAAKVRIKVAARTYQIFRFVAVTGGPGKWKREEIKP